MTVCFPHKAKYSSARKATIGHSARRRGPAAVDRPRRTGPSAQGGVNLALADFSGAEVHEFQSLLVKLNTRLLAAVGPAKTPAGADA